MTRSFIIPDDWVIWREGSVGMACAPTDWRCIRRLRRKRRRYFRRKARTFDAPPRGTEA